MQLSPAVAGTGQHDLPTSTLTSVRDTLAMQRPTQDGSGQNRLASGGFSIGKHRCAVDLDFDKRV
jgi:hypothetical protein